MRISLTVFALLLLGSSQAFGQVNWTNAAADNDLANPDNWNPPTGFTAGNNNWDVNLLGANRAVLSTALGNLQRDLRIGDNDGQGEVLITSGGSMTVTRNMRLGRGGDGVTGFGIATVDGGALTVNTSLFVGQSANTGNVFSLNSGSVTVGDVLNVAHQADTHGTLNIAGGTFNVSSGAVFSDGGGGPSTSFLNLSGDGAMTVGGNVSFADKDGGATSTVSISDNASLTANNVRVGFGNNSVATVNISGGSLIGAGFITMGQGTDADVTVNMTGGAINADRLIFANNDSSATLNMTGGSFNLANTGGGQSTAGALVMGSAGATLNIGGDAVVNAEKLYLNSGGLMTLSGNALLDISGSTDGTNPTFDFSIGLTDWSLVNGKIDFASTGALLRVTGESEGSINFVNLFNEAINEGVFFTTVSGGSFNVGYNAGGNFSFVQAVPEPSSLLLVGVVGGLLGLRRQRRPEVGTKA